VESLPPKPPDFPPPGAGPNFPPPKPAGVAAFPPPPSFAPPSGVKFPAAPAGGPKPLVLPRRVSPLQRAQEAQAASAEARRSIGAIMSQSRPPWGGAPTLSGPQIEKLEKTIRMLEAKVTEREMALAEAENKLMDRERALAEAEALLKARAQLVEAAQKQAPAEGGGAVSKEQEEALRQLKEELDRQEQSLNEQREALKEREAFLDQSETSLFEKMQAQQERETELEQKHEEMRRLAEKLGVGKAEAEEPKEKA
jgi:hypothetical protein